MLFYIVFSIVAHCAYREWKGLAEDCAGGSINYTDGNYLHYAVIVKREAAAIKEREEDRKKLADKKKRDEEALKKAAEGADEEQPLMGAK